MDEHRRGNYAGAVSSFAMRVSCFCSWSSCRRSCSAPMVFSCWSATWSGPMPLANTRDLTDAQWRILDELIPEPIRRRDRRGRPWKDRRAVLNGILWVLRTGAPWADVPEREFESLRRPHIVRNALILVILILCVFRDAESTRECSGVHGTSITIPLETRMNTG